MVRGGEVDWRKSTGESVELDSLRRMVRGGEGEGGGGGEGEGKGRGK